MFLLGLPGRWTPLIGLYPALQNRCVCLVSILTELRALYGTVLITDHLLEDLRILHEKLGNFSHLLVLRFHDGIKHHIRNHCLLASIDARYQSVNFIQINETILHKSIEMGNVLHHLSILIVVNALAKFGDLR